MEISPLFFYIFATLAIAFAILVIASRRAISAAFSLIMVFLCFAAIYAMMGAHLVAALQILVYAGAVMVLFIFVIMLLNADIPSISKLRKHSFPVALGSVGVSIIGIAMFASIFRSMPFSMPTAPFSITNIEVAGGNTQVISELLFSEYIFPFELTSVLLLVAIVSSIVLAKRNQKQQVLSEKTEIR